jgi:hypothetical protein
MQELFAALNFNLSAQAACFGWPQYQAADMNTEPTVSLLLAGLRVAVQVYC